jgi:hypothetical protein
MKKKVYEILKNRSKYYRHYVHCTVKKENVLHIVLKRIHCVLCFQVTFNVDNYIHVYNVHCKEIKRKSISVSILNIATL